jgi:uncharacterized protein (TIGR03086 family)
MSSRGDVYAPEMTDVQDRYRVVSSGFGAAVRAVAPDQWGAQSPCEQWTARDLLAHVVENHRGVIASVRGGESEPLGADEDPKQAWQIVSRAIDDITGDPEARAKEMDGPTGKMPAGQIIGQFVTMDVLVHTWDLARTVGADERLDEDSVRQAYEALKPVDAMIRQPYVFGPKLEPPPDADLQTEFLYFLGRRA